MKNTQMLKKNYEFRNVLSRGKYFSGNNIELFFKKSNSNISEKINFMGIAISVKIAKAVKRNYIKRLIREAYKDIEENLETGYSFVFLWKKKVDITNANYTNIYEDMKQIFKKAKIYKGL